MIRSLAYKTLENLTCDNIERSCADTSTDIFSLFYELNNAKDFDPSTVNHIHIKAELVNIKKPHKTISLEHHIIAFVDEYQSNVYIIQSWVNYITQPFMFTLRYNEFIDLVTTLDDIESYNRLLHGHLDHIINSLVEDQLLNETLDLTCDDDDNDICKLINKLSSLKYHIVDRQPTKFMNTYSSYLKSCYDPSIREASYIDRIHGTFEVAKCIILQTGYTSIIDELYEDELLYKVSNYKYKLSRLNIESRNIPARQ